MTWLGQLNLDGDGQADTENHGGVEKAVNVYPIEHYPYWTQTLALQDPYTWSIRGKLYTEGLLAKEMFASVTFLKSVNHSSKSRNPGNHAGSWHAAGDKGSGLACSRNWSYWLVFQGPTEGHVQAGNPLILMERLIQTGQYPLQIW